MEQGAEASERCGREHPGDLVLERETQAAQAALFFLRDRFDAGLGAVQRAVHIVIAVGELAEMLVLAAQLGDGLGLAGNSSCSSWGVLDMSGLLSSRRCSKAPRAALTCINPLALGARKR